MPSRRRFLGSAAAAAMTVPAVARQTSSSIARPLPAPIQSLRDRRAEAVPIALPERERRLNRARALMQEQRIDALVICAGSSLRYFTGFEWGQSERFFAWALPARGGPFIICPAFEEGRVRERMSAKPIQLPAAAETRVYAWNEDDDPFALLARAFAETGTATGCIALEERTQFAFADRIAHASPTLTVVSGTPITAGCRSLKSPAELALMQLANDVTLSVYQAAFHSLAPA